MYKNKLLLAIAAVIITASAQAAVIGNGPPNQSGGSDMNGLLLADTFTLGSSFDITQIQFWTLQYTPSDYAGSTYWGITGDSSGSPGTVLFSGTPELTGVATGNTLADFTEYVYTIPVSFSLGAGNYWLLLHNGPTSSIPSTSLYWGWSADTGSSIYQDLSLSGPPPSINAPGSSWVSNSAALAFQVTGTASTSGVPEPASVLLSGFGLAAAMFARRKMSAKG